MRMLVRALTISIVCMISIVLGAQQIGNQVRVQGDQTVVMTNGGAFPVVAKYSDSLYVVARVGASHLGKGKLALVRSRDGGRSWSAPQVVAQSRDGDVRNPAFGVAPDGRLVLAFCILTNYSQDGRGPSAGGFRSTLWTQYSDNGGDEWSSMRRVDSYDDLVCPYGSIGRYGNDLMLSLYSERRTAGKPTIRSASLLFSSDNGMSWDRRSMIKTSISETSVLSSGKVIWAVGRSVVEPAYLTLFKGIGGGEMFSGVSKVTEPGMYPGQLLDWKDGRLLLVFGRRTAPFGVGARIIDAAGHVISEMVVAADASGADCGYPSSVVLEDGRVLTVYYELDRLGRSLAKSIIWRVPD